MENYIRIAKMGREKLCFKLTNENTIPQFLRNSITIENNTVTLYCLEGIQRFDFVYGMVIAYEVVPAEMAEGKNLGSFDGIYYNVWWKKNAANTLIEKDGKFHDISKPVKAFPCTEEIPDGLNGGNAILGKEENVWKYNVSWSPEPLEAEIGKGYWIEYGEGDINYLRLGTPSSATYFVCDEEGNMLQSLDEFATK